MWCTISYGTIPDYSFISSGSKYLPHTYVQFETHTHTHIQKITQLEEVINCQKDELQFMRDQIKQLTDGEANADDNSGGLSLPANVSETGPLKRQLIKLQHATKVSLHISRNSCNIIHRVHPFFNHAVSSCYMYIHV